MTWFLIKMLFSRTKFTRILKKYNKEELLEWQGKALLEENYELAAYVKYYLEFKFKEKEITIDID